MANLAGRWGQEQRRDEGPTYGGGAFQQAWQPSFGPGSSTKMLQVEAAKQSAYIANVDMQMAGLKAQQEMFYAQLMAREEEWEEKLGFERERLETERLLREKALGIQEALGEESLAIKKELGLGQLGIEEGRLELAGEQFEFQQEAWEKEFEEGQMRWEEEKELYREQQKTKNIQFMSSLPGHYLGGDSGGGGYPGYPGDTGGSKYPSTPGGYGPSESYDPFGPGGISEDYEQKTDEFYDYSKDWEGI